MCEQTIYLDAAVATTLAMDLKWIMNSLRKIRKTWKYCMRGKAGDWPEWAGGENWPHVLELVQLMAGFENEEDDLAASWNLAEGSGEDDISELCGLWNMGPAETPSRGSDKRLAELNMALEDKRQKVLSDLRDVQISIEDSDEDRAPAASASSGARKPASEPDAVAHDARESDDRAPAASASSGARQPASEPDAVAPGETAINAAEDIAYDARPDFVHDVAAVLKEEPPL
ncbi:unnamed protein product [Symbiodinium sp. CCMP2456]|nr:unnamed protein product [Symbiodinium sp. CCMP2456]